MNKDIFLTQSTIYNRALLAKGNNPDITIFSERQASAKIHCLYGVPILLPKRTQCARVYPYATSVVYDIRNYKDDNFWGPYIDDGQATVDWERLEAIMIVLGHNMQFLSRDTNGLFQPVWVHPFRGANPGSFRPVSLIKGMVPAGPENLSDPYNIHGTWMRVCISIPRLQYYH